MSGQRSKRQRSRGQKTAFALGTLCGLVLLGGLAWIVVTGLLARSELSAVRHDLPKLRTAISERNLPLAHDIAADLQSHTQRADKLTSGPAWWVTSNLPWLGDPARTVRVIAEQGNRTAVDVVPGVLSLGDTLDSQTLRAPGTINLAALREAAPALTSAATAAGEATAAVAATPSSTWLSPVDDARASVLNGLQEIAGELTGADNAVTTLVPMLGDEAPRRYFIGFQNEAEMRGLGGLPGAFAVMTADAGTIKFTNFGNTGDLLKLKARVDLGEEFDARYGNANPTGDYRNSNISPHFPYAAQIWSGLWQAKTGEHVDGAIAVDPAALGYLLDVTGSFTLPGGRRVSAASVVALVEKDVYALTDDDHEQDALFVQVAKSASNALLRSGGRSTDMARAAAHAANERRIMVWSSVPDEEQRILDAGYGGVLGGTTAPYSGFTVVNAAGTKLDYYLKRTMTYERRACDDASTAHATFTVANTAPAHGLPAYVTFRADDNAAKAKAGDNRLIVTYYGTHGATIKTVMVDGKAVTFAASQENGLTTLSVDIELPAGASRTISVDIDEPASTGKLTVLRQPGVNAIKASVSGDKCS